jgi:hypothetical protein
MAHYDRAALPGSVTILAAGVGKYMVGVAGECAGGFAGHTIASACYLRDVARRALAKGAARADRGTVAVTGPVLVEANERNATGSSPSVPRDSTWFRLRRKNHVARCITDAAG